jgi:hypothetical protein
MLLSKVYTAIFNEGLATVSGPSIAAMMLRNLAKSDNPLVQKSQSAIVDGIFMEIRRLSNVVVSTNSGWQTLMLEDALKTGAIDEDAYAEAEGQIVFFIAASGVLRGPQSRKTLKVLMDVTESIWQSQTTLLNVTEYANSLPTLMPDENIGEKVTVSSVPH